MNTIVVLLHGNRLYQVQTERSQTVSFGSGKKDTMQVSGFEPNQISVKIHFNSFSVFAKKQYGIEETNVPLDTFLTLDKRSKTLIYATFAASKPTTLTLPYQCRLSVGRSDDNDIVLKFPFISARHFILRCESGVLRVEDCNSTNGVYLNGKKAEIARMDPGDVLAIMSVKITFVNGALHFENVGSKIQIHALKTDKVYDHQTHASAQINRLVYRRSPRARESLPVSDIILANAPNKAQRFEKSRGMLSSLAGSSAMLAGSLAVCIASLAMLAARAASMVSPFASVTSNRSSNKKRRKKAEQFEALRQEKYGAYIQSQKARIEAVARVQREIVMRENPNPHECAEIVAGLRRNLWERTPGDSDFLDLRLGMGYEPLCAAVKTRQDVSAFRMEEDEVTELARQIIEETRLVDHIPLRVSLAKYPSVGVVGSREKEIRLVQNLLVSLCTLHCYEDVRLVGIFDEREKAFWEPIRWFPHIWDENRQFRFLAFDRRGAHEICEMLGAVISDRQANTEQSYLSVKRSLPHYVLVFGSKEAVEREPVMQQLLDIDSSAGVTSVFVFDDLYSLPHHCKFIIDADDQPTAFEKAETNKKYFFTPDPPLSRHEFDALARRLSAVELDGFSKTAAVPDSITFLNGFGVSRVGELHADLRWEQSQPYDSLAAPLGVMRGEKTFSLDIHEKAHGPHGLVAGTTGSGKSELLQAWILSMAITFHPHDVVFVLIDYKGGGMANLLEPLPHVVGKITNIGAGIGRSLISLQSEIKRRQHLFDQYGVNHIDKYQRLYKNGMAAVPLPHLIIVADEFAELKKEEPEFMSGLVSASRVGRSLGIHLILATQKPGGIVDDQIQSNSRFRLCLKVQDITDSREMIKRPDAARLTQAGRAYIRVGEDEYFDLFQSYYSGAPYQPDDSSNQNELFEVSLVETNGARVQLIPKRKPAHKTDTDELQAVVRYVSAVAGRLGVKKLPGPWLPELPEQICLQDLKEKAPSPTWPQLPIGLYDSPKTQSQGVQTIDFSSEGHYAIYGATGTGKTNLLKTVLTAIGEFYQPNEICAYIIDAGGWSLSAFAELPHVGGIALDSEEEKIEKLQLLIMQEFERRKKLFLRHSVSSLRAYRADISADLPAVVVAVDNIVPLFELYPDIESFFVTIARDGATYGIYLLYTANSTSGVRYKIIQNIRGAIAFELTDKGDYPTVVGRPEEELPKIAGRAYFKGKPPVVFQAATAFHCDSDREQNELIKRRCAAVNAEWKGVRPKAIPVMPERLSAEALRRTAAERTMAVAGLSFETTEPFFFDLSERYCLLIAGEAHSGKSAQLLNMTRLLSDTKAVVIDSKSGSLAELKKSALYYSASDDDQTISEIAGALVATLNDRKRKQNAAKKEEPSLNEKAFALGFEQIAIVIDDLKEFVDEVSDRNKDTMERICRMAAGLGIVVLCACRTADATRLNEIESLTRVIVACQNGLGICGSPSRFPFFKNNLKYSEKEIEAGKGNAYAYSDGVCKKIKIPQEV